jgi:hypothetical protein
MRRITLHSGTMLASNASNHVPAALLNAIPASRPNTTKAMKISPVGHAEDLDADLGSRTAEVFEIHAEQQSDPADRLEQGDQAKPASNGSKIKSACHGRHCAGNGTNYYKAS